MNDSKKLSEKKRDVLAVAIRENALAWCVAEATVEEIVQKTGLSTILAASIHQSLREHPPGPDPTTPGMPS